MSNWSNNSQSQPPRYDQGSSGQYGAGGGDAWSYRDSAAQAHTRADPTNYQEDSSGLPPSYAAAAASYAQHYQQHQQRQQQQQQLQHQQQQQQYQHFGAPQQQGYANQSADIWKQQSGGYAPQLYDAHQQQQNMSMPQYPHTFQLNVNAASFVPQTVQHQPQQQQQQNNMEEMFAEYMWDDGTIEYDAYVPAYASAPMYGMSGYVEPSFCQNHVKANHPTMTQFYGDSMPDEFAYDQMYSLPVQQYVPSQELQQKITSCGQAPLLTEIQVGLEQLMNDSDEFESWAGAIKERMQDPKMTKDGRLTAVQIIAEMAVAGSSDTVSTGNPQHAFARLVAYLCSEMPSLLIEALLPALQPLHASRNAMDPEPRNNLLLFVAEVYDKVEYPKGKRIPPIGTSVREQIEDIIKVNGQINDTSMKNVIQVLKLTGRHLDAMDNERPNVDKLLTLLSAYAKGHPQLSESIKTQIHALIELREKNWGCGAEKLPSTSIGGPVFSVDGKAVALSEEERLFLEENFGELEGDVNADEAEMMKEYETYLKQEEASQQTSAVEGLQKLNISEEEKKS